MFSCDGVCFTIPNRNPWFEILMWYSCLNSLYDSLDSRLLIKNTRGCSIWYVLSMNNAILINIRCWSGIFFLFFFQFPFNAILKDFNKQQQKFDLIASTLSRMAVLRDSLPEVITQFEFNRFILKINPMMIVIKRPIAQYFNWFRLWLKVMIIVEGKTKIICLKPLMSKLVGSSSSLPLNKLPQHSHRIRLVLSP